jgi:energy-coupling factor transporter transmembrane protein EcfT
MIRAVLKVSWVSLTYLLFSTVAFLQVALLYHNLFSDNPITRSVRFPPYFNAENVVVFAELTLCLISIYFLYLHCIKYKRILRGAIIAGVFLCLQIIIFVVYGLGVLNNSNFL